MTGHGSWQMIFTQQFRLGGYMQKKNIEQWEKQNLFEQCIICKNKYSSQECEMCEDFDMFERKER